MRKNVGEVELEWRFSGCKEWDERVVDVWIEGCVECKYLMGFDDVCWGRGGMKGWGW